MKKIIDRRRLHSFSANPQQQRARVQKMNSKVYSNTPTPSSEYKKIIKDLQLGIKQQRQKRKEAQDLLSILKQRSILRQKQFYRILQRTNKQVKKYTQPEISSDGTADLDGLYQQIFVNFQRTNQATIRFIQNRYKDNYNMMERRVGIIMQNFNDQVTKNKKLSEESYRNIKEQIQIVLNMARLIDDQNKILRQKIKDQKFKNKLLNEQKQLLIVQIIQKKKSIVKLYKRAQNSAKQSRISINQEQGKQKIRNLSSTNAPDSSNIVKYICEPSIDINEFVPNKSLNLHHNQKRNSVQYSSVNGGKILKKKETVPTIQKTNQIIQHKQKTIFHLKSSLERERKKVIELGNIVTQIQNKNNQINDAIVSSFQKSKTQSDKLTDLLKSQKLFQTIKDLKKRLAMCQKPNLICGWGQHQLQQILQK